MPRPPSWARPRTSSTTASSSPPWLRRTLNKVYPDHWSFLLGEIALYSFIVLLLSGTYLTFFFDASMREVVYDGSYAPLRGVEMSAAYDSALQLSFDVRGGLFMRQMHHWAALLFVASIVVHLLRIFFTGAFRRPRETNWIIGVIMLVLALLMGVTGYSLPDDLLSGTGLRIISAILLSIPVIGTWAHFAVFNGDYVGEQIIGRFYIVHVLLIPAILLALIGAAPADPGQAEAHPVPRRRAAPSTTSSATGSSRRSPPRRRAWSSWCSACAPLLGGLVQINPIWLWGPYNPAQVSAASQPDWYIGFLDGSTRLFPPWDINLPGSYTIPALFWPTVVIAGAMFTVLALYPIIERKLTKDTASHHLLQRPRDVPVRTALGRHGPDVLPVAVDVRRQRRHRRQVRHQPERDDLGRPDRRLIVLPPIVYVLTYRHLPRPAAARPRGARARHRDRCHPAAAQR